MKVLAENIRVTLRYYKPMKCWSDNMLNYFKNPYVSIFLTLAYSIHLKSIAFRKLGISIIPLRSFCIVNRKKATNV